MYLKQINPNHPTDPYEEGWVDEYPTEPNTFWWFYGYRYGEGKNCFPELIMVEVWEVGGEGSGSYIYVAGGVSMSDDDGAVGKWKKAVLPLEIKNASQEHGNE